MRAAGYFPMSRVSDPMAMIIGVVGVVLCGGSRR